MKTIIGPYFVRSGQKGIIMTHQYKTKGTCSSMIDFEIATENGVKVVKNVQFTGGCNGNLKGIGSLVEGQPVDWVIERTKGVRCGFKNTSCPDQLAEALSQAIAEEA